MPDELIDPDKAAQRYQDTLKAGMETASSQHDALVQAIQEIVPDKYAAIMAQAAYNIRMRQREQSGESREGYFA